MLGTVFLFPPLYSGAWHSYSRSSEKVVSTSFYRLLAWPGSQDTSDLHPGPECLLCVMVRHPWHLKRPHHLALWWHLQKFIPLALVQVSMVPKSKTGETTACPSIRHQPQVPVRAAEQDCAAHGGGSSSRCPAMAGESRQARVTDVQTHKKGKEAIASQERPRAAL